MSSGDADPVPIDDWLYLWLPQVDVDGRPLCVACGVHAGPRYPGGATIMRNLPSLGWLTGHRKCIW